MLRSILSFASLRPRVLVAVVLAAGSLVASARTAQATFTLSLQQSGNNVVLTGSGTLNTTALTLTQNGQANGGILPSRPYLFEGTPASTTVAEYLGATNPGTFGSSASFTAATSGSGDVVGLSGAGVYVPLNYVSGAQLSGTCTFANTTLAAFGAYPGVYTSTWGNGANADSMVFDIGVVPEPSTWAMVGAGAGLLGLTLRQRRRGARPEPHRG